MYSVLAQCVPSLASVSQGEGKKRRKRRVEREKRKSKSEQEGNRQTDRDSQSDRQIREKWWCFKRTIFPCLPVLLALLVFQHLKYQLPLQDLVVWCCSGNILAIHSGQSVSSLFFFLILSGLVTDYTFVVFYHRLPPGVCLQDGSHINALLIYGPGLPPSVTAHPGACILFSDTLVILLIQSWEKLLPQSAHLKNQVVISTLYCFVSQTGTGFLLTVLYCSPGVGRRYWEAGL